MSELNAIRKDFKKVDLKIALCYPNLYQAGIACYAIQLLYQLFNSFENVQCERVYYTPKISPVSIESKLPLQKFDIICFSLQYELDYLNLLEMVSSAGIQVHSEGRTSPLIIAGGPCALENPLPLSPFIDIFVPGDLEPILEQLISLLTELKSDKIKLEDLRDVPGLYVPSIYNDQVIRKLTAPNLDNCFHPTSQLTSDSSPFGRSLLVEVTRGCPRGCRFCLIGYQALPMRSRSLQLLKDIIIEGVKNSQVDRVTLIGPSLSDYPHLEDLCAFITEQGLNFSLPSMRVETLSEPFLEIVKSSGLRTIAIAPEAGTESLRAAIGKPISDDLLMDRIISCADARLENLKLYFLLNLPRETPNDIEGIKKLLNKIIQKAYRPNNLHLSINPFIPKPHTPFQWEPPINVSALQKTIKPLQKGIRQLKIYNFDFLDPRWARIQGLISRADATLGKILLHVLENGGSLGAWRKIAKEFNYSIDRTQIFLPSLEETLPWDFIDVQYEKEKLLKRYEQTYG
jgi:radical SAM superfamily enzyme YgiQ (UPF0313 family)